MLSFRPPKHVISIPAPARGANEKMMFPFRLHPNFNSGRMWPNSGPYFNSAPRGGERPPAVGIGTISDFNSRPREGANRRRMICPSKAVFQFPPREGRTDGRTVQLPLIAISIPAPARGEQTAGKKQAVGKYFNSAPRGGERRETGRKRNMSHFNSAPAGANRRAVAFIGNSPFQFRPPRGANFPILTRCQKLVYFNSRPARGEQMYAAYLVRKRISIPPPRGRTRCGRCGG